MADHGALIEAISDGWYQPNERGGLCHCGCGEQTRIPTTTSRSRRELAGFPMLFRRGHATRVGRCNPKMGKTRAASIGWKGGRHVSDTGYVLVYAPWHPHSRSGGYVLEHRLVMEKALGRVLDPEEVVHHENDDREDNRIENLRLFATTGEHSRYHWALRRAKRLAAAA